jgi:hypothetical protein
MRRGLATIGVVCSLVALVAPAVSPLYAGQGTSDRPPASAVPVAERLWTAVLATGNSYDSDEPGRLQSLCGVEPRGGVAHDAWITCRKKNVRPVPHRVATVHAAPNETSAVVATIFEQALIFEFGELLTELTVELSSNPGVLVPWPGSSGVSGYGLYVSSVQRRGNWVPPVARSNPVPTTS